MRTKSVSPIVATIMIVGLTVAAGALVWSLVIPSLQGSNALTATNPIFSDTNHNGKYDQAMITLFNAGTNPVAPTAISMKTKNTTYTWSFTSNSAIPVTGNAVYVAKASNSSSEVPSNTNVDLSVQYKGTGTSSGSGSAVLQPLKTVPVQQSKYLPQIVKTPVDKFAPLVYRTSHNDASKFRDSFPGPGYSPTLVFLLGAFDGHKLNKDYILKNTKTTPEQNYRPYVNDTYKFKVEDHEETNNKFVPYNDTGKYPGLIDFTGKSFDNKDPLNWHNEGTAYVGVYIYNPTKTSINVGIYYQSSSNAKLWANGVLLKSGVPDHNEWTHTPIKYTFNPGYTYLLLKSVTEEHKWDAQMLFTDVGNSGNLSQLQSRWVVSPPKTAQTTSNPNAMVYRNSADSSGTTSGTFPGPGYSPSKFFLLGRINHGKKSVNSIYKDYIKLMGHGSEATYRPSIGSNDKFTGYGTDGSTDHHFVKYKDSGNTIGNIDFTGEDSRFDSKDQLGWNSKGIVYVGFYLNNPGKSDVTIGISVQSADHFRLWVNGNNVENHVRKGWNKWGKLNNVTLTPGLNYFLIKSLNTGGDWNVNVLIKDTGAKNDLTKLANIWPTSKSSDFTQNPKSQSQSSMNSVHIKQVNTRIQTLSNTFTVNSLKIAYQESKFILNKF